MGFQVNLGTALAGKVNPYAGLFVPGKNNSGPAAGTFVPRPGDKANLGAALQNLHMFHPNDQVRVIQRATQAGLLNKGHASSLVSGILNNQKAPNVGGFKPAGIVGAVTAPIVNRAAPVMNFAANVPAAARTLGQAVTSAGNSIVKPIERIPANATIVATNLANKALGRAPITAQQAASVPKSPVRAGVKFAGATGSKRQLAGDVAQTGSLAIGGGEAVGAKGLALTSAKLGIAGGIGNAGATISNNPHVSRKDLGKAILEGTAAGIALPFVGHGVGAVKRIFVDGPEKLLNNTRVSSLVDRGREANAPKRIPVTGGGDINTVDVRTPTKVPVSGTSTADRINVRTPQKMSDQQFRSEFNSLSKSYDRETKQLQAAAATMPGKQLQAASQALENKYQGKLNDLQDRYHNPPLSDAVAPKPIRVPRETKAPTTAATKPIKVNNPGGAEVGTPGIPAAPAEPNPVVSVKRASGAKEQYIPQSKEELATYQKHIDDARLENGDKAVGTAGTPDKHGDVWHISSGTQVKKNYTVVDKPPQIGQASAPVKVSGSALKSEQRAVEAKLATEFEHKAGYESGSYKQEASKAVELVQKDPQKALDIATGVKTGDNAMHEVAVARALEQKALKEGDVDTLTQLAQSSRHTATSEAAQRLGAEGYQADPHSPVARIKEVIDARTKAAEKKLGSAPKAVNSELEAIRKKTPPPSKQDWHEFVESIKCK